MTDLTEIAREITIDDCYQQEMIDMREDISGKHLMKVRVRQDGTLNGDDIFNEREKIVKEQRDLLRLTLIDFCDTINLLDARYFDEIKDEIWSLQETLNTTTH